MKRAALPAFVALILALIGWRATAEFSAWLAFDIAERQPWSSILGRHYLAAPVHALSFRPGSMALVKLLAALGTPLDPWLPVLKGLVAVPFAFVATTWLTERAKLPGAAAAVVLVLLTPAALFNTWHLGEFDLLGAALLLAGDLALLRGRKTAVLWFVAAILLKDSVAALALVFLAVHAWEARAREGTWDTKPGRLLVGCAAALAVLFLRRPEWGRLLGGPGASLWIPGIREAQAAGGPPGPPPWGPAVVALAQSLSLLGPTAVAALLLKALPRLPAAVALGLAAVAVFAPEPARFQIYLSAVYGSVAWVVVWGTLLVAALALLARREPAARIALGGVLLFIVLPVVMRMRGDLSTRVFLPLAIPLFGLVGAAVIDLARRGGPARAAAALLAVGLLWQGVGGAGDFGARFLSLERVELETKRRLVDFIGPKTWLFAVHRAWLVHPNELAGLGLEPDVLLRRPVLPYAVQRPDGPFPGAPMGRVVSAEALRAADEHALLFEVGLRTQHEPALGSLMRGSFSIGGSSPWPVPPHSFEDDHYRVYGAGDALAGLGVPGASVADWHLAVPLPPPRASKLTEALFGRPLIERVEAVGRVIVLRP